jgi:homogentisate 1,2-dioxygenase
MSFMFETLYQITLTDYAVNEDNLNVDYYKKWDGMAKNFNKD